MAKLSSLIDYLNILSVVIGLPSISTAKSARRSCHLLKKWGRINAFYCFFLFAVNFLFTAFNVVSFVYYGMGKTYGPMHSWVILFWRTTYDCISLTTILITYFCKGLIHHTMDSLVRLDQRLGLYNGGWIDKTAFSMILGSSSALFSIVLVIFTIVFDTKKTVKIDHIYQPIVVLYNLLVVLIGELQFQMMVLFTARASRRIRERIRVIMETEESCLSHRNYKNRRPTISSADVSSPRSSSGGCCEPSDRKVNGIGSFSRLRDLMKMQLSVFHCKMNIGKAFGWQLLLKAIFDFSNTTILSYGILSAAIAGDILKTAFGIMMTYFSVWFIFSSLIGLVHKISACEDLYKEEDLMRKIISQGIINRASRDQHIILSLFYQQTLLTTGPMDAKGFFVLNYKFMTSVTASIITYIFILLQFQQYLKDTSSIFDINKET